MKSALNDGSAGTSLQDVCSYVVNFRQNEQLKLGIEFLTSCENVLGITDI